jgi:hypothetical protein
MRRKRNKVSPYTSKNIAYNASKRSGRNSRWNIKIFYSLFYRPKVNPVVNV